MSRNIIIIGAGLTGAVIARQLADSGTCSITLFERRDHLAGNCFTFRDPASGTMLHKYGPHIFHTNDTEVWTYIQRFALFEPFKHRVVARYQGRDYGLPVNLDTINAFYGTQFTSDEARDFIASRCLKLARPAANAEEQALSTLGHELFNAFYKGYIAKQWSRPPSDLPASVAARLPMRFDREDCYFGHKHQGQPRFGYTALVEALLDHPAITVHTETEITRADLRSADHVFWSGPLDAYFDHAEGRLGYRTLRFEELRAPTPIQGRAVVNYSDPDVPWTRIAEHSFFTPWETPREAVAFREYADDCSPEDEPFYPIRLISEKAVLARYIERAKAEKNITFAGRMGTYRYIDMDIAVREALDCAAQFLRAPDDMPVFSASPI